MREQERLREGGRERERKIERKGESETERERERERKLVPVVVMSHTHILGVLFNLLSGFKYIEIVV